MSIYDDLRQDHDQVKALLSEIERTSRTMLDEDEAGRLGQAFLSEKEKQLAKVA